MKIGEERRDEVMKADSVDYLMLTVVGGKESIEKRRVGGERIITKGVGV